MGLPSVRLARPEDAAEIVHLGALMYKSVGAKTTPRWALDSIATVRTRLSLDSDLYGYVIDAPEGGLASCGLMNITPRLPRPGAQSCYVGYVQWVSTAPQHHRKGYAKSVMEALLARAVALDIEVVELHASPQGLALYEDLGFFVKDDNIAMRWSGPDRPAHL